VQRTWTNGFVLLLIKETVQDWRCGSVVQYLPSMHKSLDVILALQKPNQTKTEPESREIAFFREKN
jgi:hypothetical protein